MCDHCITVHGCDGGKRERVFLLCRALDVLGDSLCVEQEVTFVKLCADSLLS